MRILHLVRLRWKIYAYLIRSGPLPRYPLANGCNLRVPAKAEGEREMNGVR